ncbi:alpha/beta hydrolase [Alicyclobacillus fastidiosus]|uniref:Alpha/beta hydrolase n=2 Tax=Alicyclobacillus fastidiosus TaxID=392011 RepID=A0ABV5AM84_9BACL|nr:alpha/beta hydrolase [Alicyclobacillus fastidiosus]WEH09024.1 alpha/beta hydrolase [Alicyclobacillus fastidiosus]
MMSSLNPASQYYASMATAPNFAREWSDRGKYITWDSTVPENARFGPLDVFTICAGNIDNPAILFIHGYPTSSFDFRELFEELSLNYYVCALDTPGYGFSSKPRDGYLYSIHDDARLVDHVIREVFKLDKFALFTHDKGDSVGLALLELYQKYDERPYQITRHFITNGNIYLPLAQLTQIQKQLLDPVSGPVLAANLNGTLLAQALATSTYSKTLSPDEIASLASIFDYQDGAKVQHDVIQYLNQRSRFEVGWLETLRNSDVPATLIWGEQDQISPIRVADYVWTKYLKSRNQVSTYWRIPQANHYFQNDAPRIVASIVNSELKSGKDLYIRNEEAYRVL